MKFEDLAKINVNDYTESKNGLTYLSWTYAWSEIKKRFPNATYEIKKFENNLPYVYDENTGYMVFTEMTIEGLTHEMWLPVMDGNNKAMLNHEYTYKVKDYGEGREGQYKEKTVAKATMFDINKTIMRCLVKNIAMFGLGIYIYSGEDYPEGYELSEDEALKKVVTFGKYKGLTLKEVKEKDEKYLYWIIDSEYDYVSDSLKSACSVLVKPITKDDIDLFSRFQELLAETETDREKLYANYGVDKDTDLTEEQLKDAISILEKKLKKKLKKKGE